MLDHVRYSWEFLKATISVPEKKVAKMADLCNSMLDSTHVRVASIESIQGKFISVEKAVPYGRIHYGRFQSEIVRHVRSSRNRQKLSLSANIGQTLQIEMHHRNQTVDSAQSVANRLPTRQM